MAVAILEASKKITILRVVFALTPSLASIHLEIAGTDAPVRGFRSSKALVTIAMVVIFSVDS